MRIMHIINDAETGGAQTLIESLAARGDRTDELHIVVLLTEGALSARLDRVADSVSYLAMNRRLPNLFRAVRKLRGLIRRHEIELLHSHLLQADLISAVTPSGGLPRVSTIHTSGSHESSLSARILTRVFKLVSSRMDVLVACSPSAAKWVRHRAAQGRHVQVIPNGAPLGERPADQELRDEFVSLARWHPMKDHANLFASFAEVIKQFPSARLVCAGHDIEPTNEALAKILRDYRLERSVSLRGSVADVDVLLRGAAALIISSSHGEALPMAGIESLRAGTPVVATDVGDCAQLVTRPSHLTPPRSAPLLSAALISVLAASAQDRREMRAEARSLAESRFDIERTASAYSEVYSRLRRKT
jgi:glycosyltransferase involved in cell wall biosynthesis